MANRRRGEIEAVLAGERHKLVLTLGALAELEDAFGVADLVALGRRLAAGGLSARDITHILQAGLHGAGSSLDASRLPVARALPEILRAVTELLTATFGQEEAAGGPSHAVDATRPFPWEEAMRLGFGVLRLSSRAFWGMTPRELAAAAGIYGPPRAPLSGGELAALMRAFPDDTGA
ncbi:rcc01693 family protein [Pseudochelatococcus lubricantis]|uniref:rcc01693 family protein n=1 Tax=Pseudochelatococcus lubricantis TaxID=1538102 RepID=UPI0035EEFD30